MCFYGPQLLIEPQSGHYWLSGQWQMYMVAASALQYEIHICVCIYHIKNLAKVS